MRIILTSSSLWLILILDLSAQNDFATLDRQTYQYYLDGDYKNLRITGNKMLEMGIDYYFLRLRLGILAFNDHDYSSAAKHFEKALAFNSLDTISREYIWYCYKYSGRQADARLYNMSLPDTLQNHALGALLNQKYQQFYIGSTLYSSNTYLYYFNYLFYEAIRNSFYLNAGFESTMGQRFKGTFTYTNYRKSGTVYSAGNPRGTDWNFSQNQLYAKITGYAFRGWEFSGFTHLAFYNHVLTEGKNVTEYILGAAVSKSGWKVRTGINGSVSNFNSSTQLRSEAYMTILPKANLNLYFTTGGMIQADDIWGNTYQVNQNIGFRALKSLWIESGIIQGNSFLYCRDEGAVMNNSYQIPALTLYGNFVWFITGNISLTVTPFYIKNEVYSWDLENYARHNKLNSQSIGGSIKLTYKNR